MAIFLTRDMMPLFCGFMGIRFRDRRIIDLFDYIAYCSVDFVITENFLCGIHEKYIQTSFDEQIVLLLPVALAYSSLEEVPFYGSLEKFLWNGYHHPVLFLSCASPTEVSHTCDTAMPAFGKKS